MSDESDRLARTNIADTIKNWVVAGTTIIGVFGGMIYWQITSNSMAAATAISVQEIKQSLREIRVSLDGLPQRVITLESIVRDHAVVYGLQDGQINNIGKLLAETIATAKANERRLDNLERASGARLRP